MSKLVLLHIAGGGLALLGGYVALFTRKGGDTHLKSGLIFVYAMLVMGISATIIAVEYGLVTALGGPLVAYLVVTATTTVRPPSAQSRRWDRALMIGAGLLGLSFLGLGVVIAASPTKQMDGVPAAPLFMNGTVALLGALGDIRILRHGPLRGRQRLARHLWRMCYALFVAAGSFFLGQQQVIPQPLRLDLLLITASVLPLLAMLYWLVRLRVRNFHSFAHVPVGPPAKALLFLLAIGIQLFPSPASGQSLDSARTLFSRGRYSEAREKILSTREAPAASGEAAYYLGRIALAEDDEEEAVRQLERAVRLADDSALYHYWLGRALYLSAPHASKIKLPGIATRVRREWERAVMLDDGQLDARAGLAEWYSMAPGVMGGSKRKAADQVAFLMSRDPLRGALARGVLAQHEGNRAAEEAAYELATSIAPDTIAGYVALAEAFARWNRYDDAFSALRRYAERRSHDRWTSYYVGRLSASTGQRLQEGEAALRGFLRAAPANAGAASLGRAYYWLGQIAEKRGDKVAAREQYRLGLQANPNSKVLERAIESLR